MTGYVYNPSKKITELLSQYLEFDPEQLKLGIWSGDLSLSNVSLRQEAIYPILNQHLQRPPANSDTYAKPPLRFKLVSGTVGSLDLKIPWKRLVWGPGDVEVKIRNLVIVLALETVQEAEDRIRAEKGQEELTDLFPDIQGLQMSKTNDSSEQEAPPEVLREMKQARLREAERRLIEGRLTASWFESGRKRDKEKLARLLAETPAEKETMGKLDSWLRSATKDFFWRFTAGLVMSIENLKVMVQEDVFELGIIFPSIQVSNRKQGRAGTTSQHAGRDLNYHTSSVDHAAPPNVEYKGSFEDGEYVDKVIQVLGFGVYVRRISALPRQKATVRVTSDVTTQEFLLRPVDISFEFSFFYPYPPDSRKRRSKQSPQQDNSIDHTATTEETGDASSGTSSKRRRGKRDKVTVEKPLITALSSTMEAPSSPVRPAPVGRSASRGGSGSKASSSVAHRRVSSVGSSVYGSQKRRQSIAMKSTPSRVQNPRGQFMASVPLVQPDHMGDAFATAAGRNSSTARFESRLAVGVVEVVCSKNHFDMLSLFMASCSRTRNGRPDVMIRLVLRNLPPTPRTLTVVTTSRPRGMPVESLSLSNRQVHLQLQSGLSQSVKITRAWWRYAFRAIVWELRERKRLRLKFQDRYLSFNWNRQAFKRKEYIQLYIAVHLAGSRPESPHIDRLMQLEDLLVVEQILLYRTIARAIYVRGGKEMPDSILKLSDTSQIPSDSRKDDAVGSNASSDRADVSGKGGRDVPSFLSFVGAQCDVARARHVGTNYSNLSQFSRAPLLGGHGRAGQLSTTHDDTTLAYTVDTRSGRAARWKALKVSPEDTTSTAMLIGFDLDVKQLALVVVRDDDGALEDARAGSISVAESSSSESKHDEMSDVSDLTDDKRFLVNMDDDSDGRFEDIDEPPILSSTDFLLFKAPENVLLRISVLPITLSLVARSGGFRSLNLKIGGISVVGDNGHRVFNAGVPPDPPLAEIGIGQDFLLVPPGERDVPSDALALSLIVKKSGSVLEFDAAVLKVRFEEDTTLKLQKFVSCSSAKFPLALLKESSRERARLYVLRQNRTAAVIGIDCSLRVRGITCMIPTRSARAIVIPRVSHGDDSDGGSSNYDSVQEPKLILTTGMIEAYSGTAVNELAMTAPANAGSLSDLQLPNLPPTMEDPAEISDIRGLRMLNVGERISARSSILSHHWVITASGFDCIMNYPSPFYDGIAHQSFLETPIDMELLWTANDNSTGDFNRAKWEFAVEVSPVCLLLSRDRMERLAECYPRWDVRGSGDTEDVRDIARLEILSGFLASTIDFRVEAARVSFLRCLDGEPYPKRRPQKEVIKECLADFLKVAAAFDLRFPHEEALASAMQICMDRISGLGVTLEDAWEIANTALINFLDDVAAVAQTGDTKFESFSLLEAGSFDEEGESLVNLSSASVERTLLEFVDVVRRAEDAGPAVNRHDFTIDIPAGLSINTIALFYDYHFSLHIPNVLVFDCSGVHILKVSPLSSDSFADEASGVSVSHLSDANVRDSLSSSSVSTGIEIRHFLLDQDCHFGKGGLSLQVLGSDVGPWSRDESVTRESFDDVEIGDVEIIACPTLVASFAALLQTTLDPLQALRGQDSAVPTTANATTRYQRHTLLAFGSNSVLFLGDNLVPFARFSVGGHVVRRNLVPDELISRNLRVNRYSVCGEAETVTLSNLTRFGSIYENPLSSLPDPLGIPAHVTYEVSMWDEVSPKVEVNFRRVRVVFLQQFVNECLQYFSGDYGFGRLRHVGVDSGIETEVEHPKRNIPKPRIVINFSETSAILPRSTFSPDVVAVELESLRCSLLFASEFFVVPTSENSGPLSVPGISSTTNTNETRGFTRVLLELKDFRIFTALPNGAGHDGNAEDSRFHFLFKMDGDVKACKAVYAPRNLEDTFNPDGNNLQDNRVWEEVTSSLHSLDIVIDKVPYLRLLISDPLSNSRQPVDLNLRLSQFCLLLSIWYFNMQELPVVFPYSLEYIRKVARNPADGEFFPDYGTDEFKSLLSSPRQLTSEIAVSFASLRLHLLDDRTSLGVESVSGVSHGPLTLEFLCVTLLVKNDVLGVTRISSGSSSISFYDDAKVFSKVAESRHRVLEGSWADMSFGIEETINSVDLLKQSFQFSIFMVPGRSMYNLGLKEPNFTMSDLSSVFQFLGFVSAYFSDARFGNPSFDAINRLRMVKSALQHHISGEELAEPREDGASTDFRLWTSKPLLVLPSDPSSLRCPAVRLECDGFWYRFARFGSYSSQEVVASGVELFYEDAFLPGFDHAEIEGVVTRLVEGLSFGVALRFNDEAQHSDISVLIPFDNSNTCSLLSDVLFVEPEVLPKSNICSPITRPHRFLGASVCELTCVIERLPVVSSALLTFLFTEDDNDGSKSVIDSHHEMLESSEHEDSPTNDDGVEGESTFSVSLTVSSTRIFFLDPVLGHHLPVAVLSVASLQMTTSQFAPTSSECNTTLGSSGASPSDYQLLVKAHFWADYFKLGLTRSWEPLLEPFQGVAMFERSTGRGTGLSIRSDTDLHLNVSSALLVIFEEVIDSIRRSYQETFGGGRDASTNPQQSLSKRHSETRHVLEDDLDGLAVVHELPRTIEGSDRVAFAILNLTGQTLRFSKPDWSEARQPGVTLCYVDHSQSAQLSFLPSISTITNMSVIEVNFPGLPNSRRTYRHGDQNKDHAIDIQLPGFRWVQGIKVDTFGRSFAELVPKSQLVSSKAQSDWRLANALNLLVEVGLQNGGRQVTVRSLFSVVNRAAHDVCLLLHPDPTRTPSVEDDTGHEDAVIAPGELYQVPVLLAESALHNPGSHLGCVWVRPSTRGSSPSPSFEPFFENHHYSSSDCLHVEYCSRPVQLAKIVSESALLYQGYPEFSVGQDDAKTGVHVSCPVVIGSDRLSPFCYAIEVSRSPLVKGSSHSDGESGRNRVKVHGPVAYTLSIHPTFVVVNLLPERGRFELMHAVHRTVVWFADLEAGQQVAIHSVGLDAPLLLLLNLGYCKTPVGEGALVHHGVDPPRGAREAIGFKTIGKAGKAVTKHLGKTLTKIGESPDKRGHEKVFLVQNPQLAATGRRGYDFNPKSPGKTDLGIDMDTQYVDTAGGKTYRIDNAVFFPQDVAAETSVVDSIGQRLTLNIENLRGGGGQRRISIFSPFWIVNTTEHCLRYKQDKTNAFVSGTVSSPLKDGSKLIAAGRTYEDVPESPEQADLASVNPLWKFRNRTVFSGTPGALATSPGKCDLPPEVVASLVEADLPIDQLSQLSFMFNFGEGVLSLGNQKLSVQLWDGTGTTRYASDWSQGFSLDSVGFSQVIGMHCKDGRALELTVIVTVAPGILSGYTKIVRILPRYLVLSMLPYAVRLWQDSSIFRPPSSENTADVAPRERKWRLQGEKSRKGSWRVNQYESLWGRDVVLDDRQVDNIAPGSRAHPSALYVTSLAPTEIVPFTLPDSRGERQLRIDLGGSWNLTASVSADVPGEHTLKLARGVDLKTTPHVSTRGSPEYVVKIRPEDVTQFSNELGVWFETEWGNDRKLIVKAVKKDSFAFHETDIHVGDELLMIDGESVSRMTFGEAMNKLRSRLVELPIAKTDTGRSMRRSSLRLVGFGRSTQTASTDASNGPLALTFRTVEERLRRVRLKAARVDDSAASAAAVEQGVASNGSPADSLDTIAEDDPGTKPRPCYLKVELRTLQHSLFLLLREEKQVPYQVHNRSIRSTIYYRQKGCDGHPWQLLKPGQTAEYAWEEPLRPKRLTFRVSYETIFSLDGFPDSFPADSGQTELDDVRTERDGSSSLKSMGLFIRKAKDEEDVMFSVPIVVRLEEIGFRESLKCPVGVQPKGAEPVQSRYLVLEVEVIGTTRVLVVQDKSSKDDLVQLGQHLDLLQKVYREEEQRLNSLLDLKADGFDSINSRCDSFGEDVVTRAQSLMDRFPERSTITGTHQIVVEVLEANGLTPDSFAGSCNPYVELFMKKGQSRRFLNFRKPDIRRTYYVRKTVSPTWNSQNFVFKVPVEAVTSPRGYSIKIRLRNFRSLGTHQILGTAQVELHSVRDQTPLVGWFPLAGRTGRLELENPLSHWGRGSVRLRIQWIYTPRALVDYFLLISEKRLLDLQETVEGMKQQLANKRDAEARNNDAVDGFKEVRIHDLLPLRDHAVGRRRAKASRRDLLLDERKIRRIEPPKRSAEPSKLVDEVRNTTSSAEPNQKGLLSEATMGSPLRLQQQGAIVAISSENFRSPFRKQISLRENIQKLEEIISQRRLRRPSISEAPGDRRPTVVFENPPSGVCTVRHLKLWTAAQILFRDHSLVADVDGEAGSILLRPAKAGDVDRPAEITGLALFDSKFSLPRSGPPRMVSAARQVARSYYDARNSFDRAAKCKLMSVLHPGGWLIVRPKIALNLPDGYNGVFVRLRFGQEIFTTETVDAKVVPNWEPEQIWDPSAGIWEPRSSLVYEQHENQNDLAVQVTPQKTSGWMRVSVVGEKSHANLQSKTELGIVYLPLGAAIAACLQASLEGADAQTETSNSYEKWFPLMRPIDAVPVEGDLGNAHRPAESEKVTDDSFHDYFAPCIRLELVWVPENVRRVEVGANYTGSGQDTRPILDLSGETKAAFGSPLVTNYVICDIGCVSAALIDSQRAFELLCMSASDIEARYWSTKAKTRIGITVGRLQVDQQDDDAREPVMLAPTPTDYIGPVLQALAIKDNVRSTDGVVSFDFIDVSIVEYDLTLEENTLFALFDFVTSVQLRRGFLVRAGQQGEGKTLSESRNGILESQLFQDESSPHPGLLELLQGTGSSPNAELKLYIEQLYLGVLKVNLSYLKGKKQSWELTSQGGWVEKRVSRTHFSNSSVVGDTVISMLREKVDIFTSWSHLTTDEDQDIEAVGKLSTNLPHLLAALFPNVSDAPIRLQGKALNHIFESPSEIFQSIQKYYVNETLRQVYRIIGSLDFVGNPTMLFTAFFSGVRDLVMTPSQAFMRSPTDASGVGIGVAKGTLSLLSHSASGFFGFWVKISAAAGQGLTWLTLDPDYRTWHRDTIVTEATNLNREWKRRGVQSVQATLTRPVVDVALGVVGGLSGFIVLPIKGYRRNGTNGMILGIIGGINGIMVKPLVGILDALAHFAASIHDVAKSVNVLDKRLQPALRRRLPYVFGIMGILAPFHQAAARAVFLLKRFPPRKLRNYSFDGPETLVHVEVLTNVDADTYLILSSLRIILVRLKRELSGLFAPILCWEVSLTADATITSRISEQGHSGIALTLTVKKPEGTDADHEKAARAVDADDNSENAQEDDGLAGVLPTDPDALATKLGISSDHQSPFFQNLIGQFHGFGRSEQGELVEWFSVLAEYPYRSQLSRMHNAISCMAMDFEAVMRDPSISRAQSTEGFTSFGMFNFEKLDPSALSSRGIAMRTLLEAVDPVPWASKATFSMLSSMLPYDQKKAMKVQRKDDINALLELSRKEGGTDWFVSARAQAIYLDTVPETPRKLADSSEMDASGNSTKSLKKEKSKLRRWVTTPLATIPDNKILETATDFFRSPFRKDTPGSDDGEQLKARQESESKVPSRGSQATTSNSIVRSPNEADAQDGSGTRSIEKSLSTRLEPTQSGTSIDTFYTASGGWSKDDGGFDNLETRSDSCGSEIEDLSADGDFEDAAADNYRPGRLEGDQGSMSSASRPRKINAALASLRNPTSVVRANLLGKSKSSSNVSADWEEYEVRTRYQRRRGSGDDRMERMEKLMERLLIFSSEQALRGTPSASGDSHSLQSEIAELRGRLDLQSNQETQNHQVLAELRREIAYLKHQMLSETKFPGKLQRENADGAAQVSTNVGDSLQRLIRLDSADTTPSTDFLDAESQADGQVETVSPVESGGQQQGVEVAAELNEQQANPEQHDEVEDGSTSWTAEIP